MKEIEIRLFGAFRKYDSGSGRIRLRVPEAATVRDVKAELMSYFSEHFPIFKVGESSRLIADSAIANEEQVLSDSDLVDQARTLAILPPVCGG